MGMPEGPVIPAAPGERLAALEARCLALEKSNATHELAISNYHEAMYKYNEAVYSKLETVASAVAKNAELLTKTAQQAHVVSKLVAYIIDEVKMRSEDTSQIIDELGKRERAMFKLQEQVKILVDLQ